MIKHLRQAHREASNTDVLAREFNPAAIALEEAAPSRIARGVLWAIMAFFTTAVVWAVVGQVDVVAVTQGQLVPQGRSNTVQPALLGRVSGIHVNDGQSVQAGQALVTLDGTQTGAEEARLQDAYRLTQRRLDRQTAWTEYLQTSLTENLLAAPEPSQSNGQDVLLASWYQALRVKDAGLAQSRHARELEQERSNILLARLENNLPLLEEQFGAIQALAEQNMVSRMELITVERERLQHASDLESERLRIQQLSAEIDELNYQREQLWAEALEQSLVAQESYEAELDDLSQQVIKATAQSEQQTMRAPVSGVIHNLQINTMGEVVQPAQTLLEIIPDQERIIAEVWIDNRDIGFVHEGQAASLKLSAFAFTRYGTLPGVVASVSSDAILDESAGPRYLARIELEQHHIDLGDRQVNLTPGMTLSAEIATGRRRLIEFFAAPIVSALNETGRER